MALKIKGIRAKIGSRKEIIWTVLLEQTEALIKEFEKSLIINKAIRDMAKSKIKKHGL